MKQVLRPAVVIPTTLGVAVLASLVGLSDPAKVVAVMKSFRHIYLLYILALMVAYEVVRCLQWAVLLRAQGVEAGLRTVVFTFLGGEVAAALPVGTYVRNYLLQRSTGTEFGRSSAATTLTFITELAVCLAGLVILNLGSWSVWLRPLILIGLATFLLVLWILHRSRRHFTAPVWLAKRGTYRRIVEEFERFRGGATALLRPDILAQQAILGAIYLVLAGAMLYMVLRGLSIGDVSLWGALAAYLFGLGLALISPIPMDIGVIEVSGVGALMILGVSEPLAVGVMLVNRVLRSGIPLVIALVVFVLLRDEVREVL
jgi:uncharacterized protein (TIRG00374 family)